MTLIKKYNKPVPRYTSYPTVPYWQPTAPTQSAWLASVNQRLADNQDVSLYVHLPYCEELCTYCGCNKRITKRHDVESPYIKAVLAEWAIYVQSLHLRPRLKELHLGGGTPTFFGPSSLARLIDGILEHADVAPEHNFGFEAHPNSTTEDHLRVLAERGFNRLSIGVQDFNPEIMRLINRRQTTEDVERTVSLARKHGYRSINFDVIYGLPKQTTNDIIRNTVKIQQMRPERIAFYGYAHVPWVSPGQRAYDEKDLPKGLKKWNLYVTGKDMLEDSGYRDIGLDHFSLPGDDLYQAAARGSLHRNFMGYTTANTPVTLALGCSSIGDSWDTYVQNEKKVETYARVVLEEQRLPIAKGHQLNAEDQIVRRHILNLMCHGYTEWQAEAMRCGALDRAVLMWNDMAADGIIARSPYRIEITQAGKPFLRNICLPLDDHYWQQQPVEKTFSQAI
ncbi:MAG: oxygen-independent coproporphyrinogen III oxidase [Bacteroidota bacterium]